MNTLRDPPPPPPPPRLECASWRHLGWRWRWPREEHAQGISRLGETRLQWVIVLLMVACCHGFVRTFRVPARSAAHPQLDWDGICRVACGQVASWGTDAFDYGDPRMDGAKLSVLETWLDSVGVDRGAGETDPPSVQLRHSSERGLGLESMRDLEKDCTVASIPRRACLSSDPDDAPRGTLRAWAHSLFAKSRVYKDEATGESDSSRSVFDQGVAVVTFQLLLEQAAGERSSFAPWIAMLPRTEELNLPALWPQHHLAELHGTLVLRDILESLEMAEAEWRHVSSAIAWALEEIPGDMLRPSGVDLLRKWFGPDYGGALRQLTVAEWMRARCLIQSRAYRVGGRYLLIPLVDFANHDDSVDYGVLPGDGVFTSVDEVVLSSDRSYKAGQHVCTSYGKMDNAKRLFSFGFVTLVMAGNEPFARTLGALPTEAYCDVVLPMQATDCLHPFKTRMFRAYFGKNWKVLRLSALFSLCPCPPLVRDLIDGPARLFIESSMPFLRLMVLSVEDMEGDALCDTCMKLISPRSARASGSGQELMVNSIKDERGNELFVSAKQAKAATELLARLQRPVSDANEERALLSLAKECLSNLRKINLTAQDLAALGSMGRESESLAAYTVSVTQPRSVLSATVRVAEAIAWLALLEAGSSTLYGPTKTWTCGSHSEPEAVDAWLIKLTEMIL